MARPEYFIQDGLISTKSNTDSNPSSTKGLFDLGKWLKRLLKRYHVPYVDQCCSVDVDVTSHSVRFNATAGHLQYYNAPTDTWINVPSL